MHAGRGGGPFDHGRGGCDVRVFALTGLLFFMVVTEIEADIAKAHGLKLGAQQVSVAAQKFLRVLAFCDEGHVQSGLGRSKGDPDTPQLCR